VCVARMSESDIRVLSPHIAFAHAGYTAEKPT
jgi:hypothetical protein